MEHHRKLMDAFMSDHETEASDFKLQHEIELESLRKDLRSHVEAMQALRGEYKLKINGK